MQVGHPPGDGQAEPGAAAVGRADGAEPLEDPLAVGRCYALALVGDLEHVVVRAAGLTQGTHGDSAAGRAVPRGVVEQVGDQLVEPAGVGAHHEARLDVEVVAHVATGRLGVGDDVGEEARQRDVGRRERGLAGVDPGEVEEVLDELREPLRLPHGEVEAVGAADAVGEVLQHRTLGRERRAQLVADGRDELAPLRVDGREVAGHRRERPGQLPDLVPRRRRDPHVVVALRHPPGGCGHLAQRGGHPERQQLRDRERQREGDRERQPHRRARGPAGERDDRGDGGARRDEQPELDLQGADGGERPRRHGPVPGSRA